ncbi:MAG: tRNA lysidine(34) synthetase TilS, partial [Candidatus Kapaibacteriota bacterium]
RNLQWREDSSNRLLKYTRNKIRHLLIPIIEREFNPKIINNLAKLSLIAQNSFKILSSYINKFSELILVARNKSEVELNLENLTLFDNILFNDLFQYITDTYFNYTLSFSQIEELKNLVYSETGKYIVLSQRIFVYKNRKTLKFIIKEGDFRKQVVKRIPKIGHTLWKSFFIEFEEIPREEFRTTDDKFTEFFDYDKLADEIIIRIWKEGDKFFPLGMKGSKKLSDFFVDLKVPLHKKNEYPVFLSNEEIFWVGGLRISDKFKVTSKTNKVLKGRIIKIKSK